MRALAEISEKLFFNGKKNSTAFSEKSQRSL